MKTPALSAVLLSVVLAYGLYAIPLRVTYDSVNRIPVSLKIRPAAVLATVDIKPDTLNLRSRILKVTAYIELHDDLDVDNIDISSILLNNTIPACAKPTATGDYDNDAIPDLMIKFDGAQVISYIQRSIQASEPEERFAEVTLTLTGKLKDGLDFIGSDAIRVILVKPT